MNAPRIATLAALGLEETVALALAFLAAVPVPVFLMEYEPGLRPAPGRRPPHPLPFTPTIDDGSCRPGLLRQPKKSRSADGLVRRVACGPSDAHLKMEHDGTFRIKIG